MKHTSNSNFIKKDIHITLSSLQFNHYQTQNLHKTKLKRDKNK